MSKVYLLDCTLRDGGYVNNWCFGMETIKGFSKKIAETGIEMYEVGFIKGNTYDPDYSIFPNVQSFSQVIQPKNDILMYIGMLDMSAPVSLESLPVYDGTSIDGIRVIFKKDKIDEAYFYCEKIKELGYRLFVNFVGTDLYTDKEFISGIERFNELDPFAMSIVDSFGLIKRKQFLRLVYIADHNLKPNIALCYHAHNNLQQAFGNAEALVELGLKRDVCIDACVFGMGRGAGNLNLELFAEYMNENFDTDYHIDPMLEIMDEYLRDIYQTKFWGYSLPLYLSATRGCHPNYAIYLAEKDSLTVKGFNDILRNIPINERSRFSEKNAEKYYLMYQNSNFDDHDYINTLKKELGGKNILLLAPGKSIIKYEKEIQKVAKKHQAVMMAVNFLAEEFNPDYIFSSNMRRYVKIQGKTQAKCITTSNMKECEHTDYVIDFNTYASKRMKILDNSALMALKLLRNLDIQKIFIAGMDGYSDDSNQKNYVDMGLEYDFSTEIFFRNELISNEITEIKKSVDIEFITPTIY